jgi:hypothetical protein
LKAPFLTSLSTSIPEAASGPGLYLLTHQCGKFMTHKGKTTKFQVSSYFQFVVQIVVQKLLHWKKYGEMHVWVLEIINFFMLDSSSLWQLKKRGPDMPELYRDFTKKLWFIIETLYENEQTKNDKK